MHLARLKLIFSVASLVLIVAWLLSIDASGLASGFWQARGLLIPFTGILAVGFLSLAILLAARPVQVESLLGGLDKYYRLHKWLGVAAAMTAIIHWLLETAPRTLARQGWIDRPFRTPGGARPETFPSLREPAAEVGEWAFYLLLILVALALWRRFPYHLFQKTHRLMAPLFLALVFHSVVLMRSDQWLAPIGMVMVVLLPAAATAAGFSLFRRIGHSRRATGEVIDFHLHPGSAVLDVRVRLATAWPGHLAGQFAFLDFEDAEGAHPFTISSAWTGDGILAFSIKGLGDYTRTLPRQMRVGAAVTVEGPYGRFSFGSTGRPQVWIAGGVGITPFVAGLQAPTERSDSPTIDLVYSTRGPDDTFIAEIRQLAARAGARLHLIDTTREGLLSLDRLASLVPRWRDSEVWFCGPQGFGRSLRAAMLAGGLPAERFHQELFEMR